jgi:hypothetical protein
LERELGVTWWGERVEGAMGAYVLDEPTPSADAGAACWTGAGGLATTVVMVACGRPCCAGWEGQIDCRSEVWQGLVGSPLHQVSRDVGRPWEVRGWCNTKPGGGVWAGNYAGICRRAEAAKELEATRSSAGWLGGRDRQDSTRRVFWGAGVEGIKMARTDLCLHRAGRAWSSDTAAGMR